MGKVKQKKFKGKPNNKNNKKEQGSKNKDSRFDTRFKVAKSKGNKDKKNRSVTFAKYDKKVRRALIITVSETNSFFNLYRKFKINSSKRLKVWIRN